jgi:hypothetical protein
MPEVSQQRGRDDLLQLVAIMRISSDWKTFLAHFENAFPKIGTQAEVVFEKIEHIA